MATLGGGLVFIVASVVVYLFLLPALGIALFAATVLVMLFVLTERDATLVLSIFALLTLLVPSRYVLAPIGAVGTPAKVVALGALLWWSVSRFDRNVGAHHGQQPMRPALLFYLWWMLVTLALGWLRALTDVEASSSIRTAITLAALGGVALLAADGIQSRQRLETLLRRIVTLGAVAASIGILQYVGQDVVPYLRLPGLESNAELISVAERSSFPRVSGTAVHAIEFGAMIAVISPFALHFALFDRHRQGRAWATAIIVLAAIPVAVSRSAILGIAVALGVLAVRWTWNQRLLLGVLGMGLIALTRALAPGLLGTLRSLFLWWGADDSIAGRTKDYAAVYSYVSDSPWVGRGLGTFEPSQYFFLDNEWLMTMLGTGIVGLVALFLIFALAMSCARGVVLRSLDPETQHLGQAFVAALASLALLFGTFDALSFNIAAGLFFLLAGAAGAFWRLQVGDWRMGREHGSLARPLAARGGRLPAGSTH